jgi:hypothetical protein
MKIREAFRFEGKTFSDLVLVVATECEGVNPSTIHVEYAGCGTHEIEIWWERDATAEEEDAEIARQRRAMEESERRFNAMLGRKGLTRDRYEELRP